MAALKCFPIISPFGTGFGAQHTRLFSIRTGPLDLSRCLNGRILSANHIVDEEMCPDYDSTSYMPVYPGQVFNDCYQVLTKIGWGKCSTVWLSRDITRCKWQDERYITLKVNNCKRGLALQAEHERDIEKRIAITNPASPGYRFLRTHIDSFEVKGPHGKHLCLVYEPLREPLWMLRFRLSDAKLPLSLIKSFTFMFLVALDYIHSECRIVHTDLKLDNIMMTLEDRTVIKDFLNEILEVPMAQKKDSTGRTVYLSHNNFGPLRTLRHVLPKLVDFGLSQKLEPNALSHHPIQPDYYRAPEVILGCGWSYSADIWNLGVLLWNLIGNKELFQNIKDSNGEYSPKLHLAEMIALLGPPPSKLLKLSEQNSEIPWPQAAHVGQGINYYSARDYFGGPYFDRQGKFLHEDLILQRRLEDASTTLFPLEEEDTERKLFIAFIRRMLAWSPEDRSLPLELMKDPFIDIEKLLQS